VTRLATQPGKSAKDNDMKAYLIVALGSAMGGALRHGVNVGSTRLLGTAFPYGTLAVNVARSMAMGLLAAWFAFRGEALQSWRSLLTTGVLGGFTTFSAFSLDAALLYERGQLDLALGYVVVSVALSIAALFAGLGIMRTVA
jgi:CrcB protein